MTDRKIHILLVEDNTAFVKLFQYLIESSDYRVQLEYVRTMEAALSALDQDRFDLIVLDIFLPDSKGAETLTRIREKRPDTPVIILTASDDPQLKKTALNLGIKDYLPKGQLVARFLPMMDTIFKTQRNERQSVEGAV